MASNQSFVEYVTDQMRGAGDIRYRKMFGEYAVYCRDKVVALICDDRLFVKETAGGRALIGDVVEAPPYAGAKPHFLIEDRLDDPEWLAVLIRVTESELPAPKPKRPKPTRAHKPPRAADSSE
jgi:TfoX/Sxy family transcriptional regulator of competence genes